MLDDTLHACVTPAQARVLLAGDDPDRARLIGAVLAQNGFRVRMSPFAQVLAVFGEGLDSDILILELSLDRQEQALSVCRQLQSVGKPPVILVAGGSAEIDKVRGLDAGADDYLTQPLSHRELVARIRSVLRRCGRRRAGCGAASSSIPPSCS